MSDPFIGEIKLVPYNFAPRGYAFCNGQILSIAQNTALFSLLGTTFGGNGQTTFALPNLQSRVAIHSGQGSGLSPYVLGQVGGVETVNLLLSQIPAHSHALNASDQSATSGAANPNYLPSNGARGAALYATMAGTLQSMNQASISSVGGSQPHTNIQPYLTLNYIIALEGIYPSRN